ncbi:MAG: hypothetical protein JZU65_15695 [Chlorobium sp.]|nr:hypothetical protein [Chlorobium sp.]
MPPDPVVTASATCTSKATTTAVATTTSSVIANSGQIASLAHFATPCCNRTIMPTATDATTPTSGYCTPISNDFRTATTTVATVIPRIGNAVPTCAPSPIATGTTNGLIWR